MLNRQSNNDETSGASAASAVSEATARPPQAQAVGWLGFIPDTLRQLVYFFANQPMWLASMTIFVLAWTIELYVVQAVTFVYPNETGPRFAFWAPKIRLTLDLLFVLGFTFYLRRRWLVIAVVGAFFANLGLITYFHYFQRPLSLLTIFGNWREGVQLGGSAWALIPKRAALMLVLALATQLTALHLSRKASLPRKCAWLAGSLLWVAYAGLFLVANRFDPLEFIQTTRGVGRLGEIRGYLGPWFAEWYYLSDNQVLQRALEYRRISLRAYDRLTPLEADIPIHKHLVILQAESLDYNILGYKVKGEEVTPFLNALRNQSMFYRVTAMHFNGSSDADFAALNAVSGSRHENTYLIPGYPYENTTPQFLARCGFKTYSFHGNTGEFYHRRAAFDQMGFAGTIFREELERDYGRRGDNLGVRDDEVLSASAQELRTATTPTCHFVITLTTHVPYDHLPGEREIYPHPRNVVEDYVNNMRFLDKCLQQYVISLGSGTTIMIYADHPTEEGYGDFRPDRPAGREFIPCYIYDTDRDLSQLQKTRGQTIASDGTLNLVDVINYLRAQVKRVYGQSDQAIGSADKDTSPAHAEPVAP